ncbi:MAG TPA: tryptophan synthase subunit alpha [Geobacteraceae bacterium]|nr:tryptophan synthase subunit alpha [Geobacteraceae bacterium]
MSRIGKKFVQLKKQQRKALVTFVTAGDPDLALTERLIPQMAAAGADIVELGMPFSDPMADGPTIQLSSERALAGGTTLAAILAMVKRVRQVCDVPLLLMGYYNPVFIFGPERFCREAAAAGVDGVLLVDLPPEEAGEFSRLAAAAGVDLISLLTPTSDASRIDKVKKVGRGFIYYVSVAGVTGARSTVAEDVGTMVEKIRARASLPVAVGFGISTPEQAATVASVADGVVVGSALVRLFEQYCGDELVSRVCAAIGSLKAGVESVA